MRKLNSIALIFFILLTTLMFCNLSNAADKPSTIKWVSYSNNIFKSAQSKHKQILIFGKAEWCHWCQQMKSDVFIDPQVIQLINEKYIPVIVDIDEDATIANQYNITSTPTFIILNANKTVANTFYGYMPASELMSSLRD